MARAIAECKYRVVYDGDHFIDGFEVADLEEGKSSVMDILTNWLEQAAGEDDETHDMMILNCMAWVEEFNEQTGEWEECWCPSDDDLEQIGWKERGEV